MTTITVELFYGAAWHTVPVYARDPVVVTRGRTGESKDTPPSSASFTIDNRTLAYNPQWPGSPLYGAAGRYTPVRITINSSVYELEVAKWTPGRSIEPITATRGDAWVKVTAAGIRRRLGQGRDPLHSTHYRHLASVASAYWPLDEGVWSTTWADVVGGHVIEPSTFNAGQINSGQADMAPWLEKGLHLDAGTFLTTGAMSPAVAVGASAVAFTWVTRRVDATSSWEVTFVNAAGTTTIADATYYGDLNEMDVTIFGTLTAAVTPEPNVDGPLGWHLLLQESGADIVWSLYILGQTTALMSGTKASTSLTDVGYVQIFGGVNISHLAVIPSLVGISTEYFGRTGETAGERLTRLGSEESITVSVASAVAASQPMGPQYPGTILEQLTEMEQTDGGIVVDAKTGRGLKLHPETSFYNRAITLSIDYANAQLAPPTEPIFDDVAVRNDITLSRRDGGTVHSTQDTGPNNVQAPEDDPQGIGRVTDQPEVNVNSDGQLAPGAAWRRHLGTVDVNRWPTVTVDYVAAPGLPIADVGDRIQIVNLPAGIQRDIADLLVIGYTDTATKATRVIDYATVPYEPYRVMEATNAGAVVVDTPRLPSNTATTAASLTTTYTGTLTMNPGADGQWTTAGAAFPLACDIEGERVTVSGITTTAATYVGRGALSAADNAAVSPTTTGFGATDGDLLCCLGRMRTGAGTLTADAGWDLMAQVGKLYLWGQVRSGTTPVTVTPAGGAAGDTVAATVFALRNMPIGINPSDMVLALASQVNGSAQDIAYPGISPTIPGVIVFLLAGKDDDWTSVAVPAGLTESGEPSTVTGNDEGLYLAYQIQTAPAVVVAGSAVVTGGAAAVSEAMMLSLAAGYQTMTISARSVNNVVKTHNAAVPVKPWRTIFCGL